MIRLHLMVAGLRVEVEAETAHDAIREAAFFADLPAVCPKCDCGLKLTYRKSKDGKFKFWGLECGGQTPHQNTFGQHLEDNALFYKRGEWIVRPAYGGGEEDDSPHDEPPQRGNGGQNRSGAGGDYGRGGRR